MDKPQKIVRLEASNIKRLKAVRITPEGTAVVIGGKNEQGKSSVLDTICMVLGGAKFVPEMPIRSGQSRAHGIVELDDLIVTRKFSASGSSLEVTLKDGTPMKSPQAILDKLIGKLSFDPLEFSRMAEKESLKAAEVLRHLVGLDFTELNKKREKAYADRTAANRKVSELSGQIIGTPLYDDAPKEEIVVQDLTAQLDAANAKNRSNAQERTRVTAAQTEVDNANSAVALVKHDIAGYESQIDELRRKIATSQADLTVKESVVKEKEKALVIVQDAVALLQDLDTESITQKINAADSMNVKVRNNKMRADLVTKKTEAQKQSDDLSAQIDQIDNEKARQMKEAKFPIPEISFNDVGVLLNGLPFAQGSTAGRIRASMAIGLALNPTLRVVMIREGSLLDEDSLKAVIEMAEANNAQVWIERVGKGGEVSVVIEDGEVEV